MFQLIAAVLAWYYQLVHNYAAAIALLTISIMVLLTPLTLKGTKSMLELQRLQPEIKKLQAEHKGDRQKLNEEMMRLYQEHKINPLGGCLPLLLQLPVFLILYRVLRKLTTTCPGGTWPVGTQKIPSRCVDMATQFVVAKGNFGASYIKQSTNLWQDLAQGNTMMMHLLNVDLAKPATQVISQSFWSGIPYLVLVLLVAVTSYYQQRQISARTKNQQVNPQQQMIMRLMPAFFAVIALTLPAYLTIYFLASNLYRIAQQAYITRRFYHGEHEAVPAGGDSKKTDAKKLDSKKPASKADGNARPEPNRPAPTKSAKPGRVTPSKNATPAKGAPTPKSATKGSPPTRPASTPSNRPTPRSHPRPTPRKKD
jgi:YidC/Oxa1 family membrane protein insertase